MQLPFIKVAHAEGPSRFDQYLYKGVKEMHVLVCRWQAERVDRKRQPFNTNLHVAAAEQLSQHPIGATKIEDQRPRIVLLGMGEKKIARERLAGPGHSEHQGMRNVLVMQVQEIRRPLVRF